MPRSSAPSRYQRLRQFRQNPARFIMSMFCTSVRARRCSTSLRKAAASSSVRVFSSISGVAMVAPPVLPPIWSSGGAAARGRWDGSAPAAFSGQEQREAAMESGGFDFTALRRALEAGDAAALAKLYAEDAE